MASLPQALAAPRAAATHNLGAATRMGAAPASSGAARAKAAAEDFEAVFLSTMFNEMFASVRGEGPLGGAGATGVWRSFLADEYAKSFARSGGVGIGAQVYQGLLAIQEGNRP